MLAAARQPTPIGENASTVNRPCREWVLLNAGMAGSWHPAQDQAVPGRLARRYTPATFSTATPASL